MKDPYSFFGTSGTNLKAKLLEARPLPTKRGGKASIVLPKMVLPFGEKYE